MFLFQLIIEGTHGQGYTGDIGLDDFSIGNDSQCEYTKGMTSIKTIIYMAIKN